MLLDRCFPQLCDLSQAKGGGIPLDVQAAALDLLANVCWENPRGQVSLKNGKFPQWIFSQLKSKSPVSDTVLPKLFKVCRP